MLIRLKTRRLAIALASCSVIVVTDCAAETTGFTTENRALPEPGRQSIQSTYPLGLAYVPAGGVDALEFKSDIAVVVSFEFIDQNVVDILDPSPAPGEAPAVVSERRYGTALVLDTLKGDVKAGEEIRVGWITSGPSSILAPDFSVGTEKYLLYLSRLALTGSPTEETAFATVGASDGAFRSVGVDRFRSMARGGPLLQREFTLAELRSATETAARSQNPMPPLPIDIGESTPLATMERRHGSGTQDSVELTLQGFGPRDEVLVGWCSTDVLEKRSVESSCETATATVVQVDRDGGTTVPVAVSKRIIVSDRVVDCTQEGACVLGAMSTLNASLAALAVMSPKE